MRFPATALLSAACLLMSACGSWDDLPPPPPEFYTMEISCPTCQEVGVDTLRIHDLSGVRTIVLESSGRASTTSSGSSVQEEATWFSTRRGPMMVASVQEHQTEVEVELLPTDWGESPFEDTLLVRRVVDPVPDSLSLLIQSLARPSKGYHGGLRFDFMWSETIHILPDEGGVMALRLPAEEGGRDERDGLVVGGFPGAAGRRHSARPTAGLEVLPRAMRAFLPTASVKHVSDRDSIFLSDLPDGTFLEWWRRGGPLIRRGKVQGSDTALAGRWEDSEAGIFRWSVHYIPGSDRGIAVDTGAGIERGLWLRPPP